MAYVKLYNRLNWVNNTAPAINARNLNKMDEAINALDDRTVEMDGRISKNESDISNLQSRVAASENNTTSLSGRITTAEKNIAANSNLLGETVDRVGTLEYNLKEFKNANAENHADMLERIRELESDTGDIETKVSDMEDDIFFNIKPSVSELQETVDTLSRTNAGAIYLTASGKDAVLENSADSMIKDLVVNGESEQNGESVLLFHSIDSSYTVTPTGQKAVYLAYDLPDLDDNASHKVNITFGSMTSSTITVRITDSTCEQIGMTVDVEVSSSGTISVPFNTGSDLTNFKKLLIYAGVADVEGGGGEVTVDGLMIYGVPPISPDYPQEIKSVEVSEIVAHGKNLLDYELFTKKLNSNASGTFSESDGKLTIQTIANGNSGMYAYGVLPKDDVTATLSMDVTISAGSKIKFGFGAKNTTLSIEQNKKTRISMTGQISASESIIIYSGESVAKTITVENIQLEIGETATDYEPYYEPSIVTLSNPITLHGIGTAQDRIVQKDGVWGIERDIAEVVYDGSSDEVWNTNGTNQGYRVTADNVGGEGVGFTVTRVLCDRLKSDEQTTIYGGTAENVIALRGDNTNMIYVRFDSTITTVDLLKEKLASSPITVVYELATPTFEPLPEADQVALDNLKSFYGITYVNTDSEIKPVLDVEYVADTKLYIDSAIKAAIG